MGETVHVRSGGIGFAGLLTILFIGLKLAGVSEIATWSWFWVLSPLWISFLIALGFVAVIIAVGLIVAVLSN